MMGSSPHKQPRKPKAKPLPSPETTDKKLPTVQECTDADRKRLLDVVRGDTEKSRRCRNYLHQRFAGGVYLSQIISPSKAWSNPEKMLIQATAREYAEDVVKRMNPRDPLEEMLVSQALWTHGRVAHLSQLANTQENLSAIQTINDSADKASNTFRRLMLTLAEYRRPPRAGDTFAAIKQANIASQQVVQNTESTILQKRDERTRMQK